MVHGRERGSFIEPTLECPLIVCNFIQFSATWKRNTSLASAISNKITRLTTFNFFLLLLTHSLSLSNHSVKLNMISSSNSCHKIETLNGNIVRIKSSRQSFYGSTISFTFLLMCLNTFYRLNESKCAWIGINSVCWC